MTEVQIRAKILAKWRVLGKAALAAHCGGRGLVVGCPVCKRRWCPR